MTQRVNQCGNCMEKSGCLSLQKSWFQGTSVLTACLMMILHDFYMVLLQNAIFQAHESGICLINVYYFILERTQIYNENYLERNNSTLLFHHHNLPKLCFLIFLMQVRSFLDYDS